MESEIGETQIGDALASLLGGTMEVFDIVENPDLCRTDYSLSR
jgi:hypothetical protein